MDGGGSRVQGFKSSRFGVADAGIEQVDGWRRFKSSRVQEFKVWRG
jgi:hypothetical protein